jgi:hypothetical protein
MGKFSRQQGLYMSVRWNVFYTNPPLCITEQQLREGFAIIDRALALRCWPSPFADLARYEAEGRRWRNARHLLAEFLLTAPRAARLSYTDVVLTASEDADL